MRLKLIMIVSLIFLVTSQLSAQETISEDYKNALREMLDASGIKQNYDTMIKGMFDMYRRQMSEVPSEIMDGMEKEFSGDALEDLINLLIPIYHKHLNIEDIKQLTAFYNSEVGKKFVEKTPVIMREAMIVGEDWGKSIGEKFIKKLEEKGY